jgi:hypothetical protein
MVKQAKKEVQVVPAVIEVKEVVKESNLLFKDMRKEYILRVTGPCEIHAESMIKWDQDKKGVPLGGWIKLSVMKGLDDEAILVKQFIISKSERGFPWFAEAPIKAEAQGTKESV